MNKQELLNDLASRDFVAQLIETVDTNMAIPEGLNLKLYRQTFLEVKGIVAETRGIDIYVKDEGLATETAYYKDREPSAQTLHYLEEKYANKIKAIKGKVLEKGEDFIIVEGYEKDETTGEMIKKKWFAEEVNGVLVHPEIR